MCNFFIAATHTTMPRRLKMTIGGGGIVKKWNRIGGGKQRRTTTLLPSQKLFPSNSNLSMEGRELENDEKSAWGEKVVGNEKIGA